MAAERILEATIRMKERGRVFVVCTRSVLLYDSDALTLMKKLEVVGWLIGEF